MEIKADGRRQEVYFTKDMRNHHSSSILIGDHLYGFSGGILTAMRFDTGEVAWKDRSVGKGSLVFADGHLYAFSENGVVGLVEATPTGYREKGRFRIQQDSCRPGRIRWSPAGVFSSATRTRSTLYDVKAKG